MLYFHPRDLDDRLHEVTQFSAMERMRFLSGTGTSMDKLERLLEMHQMSGIADAQKQEIDIRIVELPAAKNRPLNE
jgi:hypothetical protein